MFQGSIVALITPYDDKGGVDHAALANLIEWHIASGTDGIVLCGTTGESPTLSEEEMIQIFETAVDVSSRKIPIIAGTGSNNTAKTIQLTQKAKEIGADGVLVIFPYYNRPTSEGCFQHFQELSKIGIPLIPYHHPGRTGIKLPVKDLIRIAELPNVVAIKDATADLDWALEFMNQCQIALLGGDDSLALPMLSTGALGIISIVANIIPVEWKKFVSLALEGEVKEARSHFFSYYSVIKAMVLETNPQCVKYALSLLGKCSPKMRLPLIEPQDSVKLQIESAMEKAGLTQPY